MAVHRGVGLAGQPHGPGQVSDAGHARADAAGLPQGAVQGIVGLPAAGEEGRRGASILEGQFIEHAEDTPQRDTHLLDKGTLSKNIPLPSPLHA